MVVSTLETPLYGRGDTSLPVLHSAVSEYGEGRQIGANEAHALGLNDGIDDERIPVMGEVRDQGKRDGGTDHLPYWAAVPEWSSLYQP